MIDAGNLNVVLKYLKSFLLKITRFYYVQRALVIFLQNLENQKTSVEVIYQSIGVMYEVNTKREIRRSYRRCSD